jgi:hypothetical protein
LPFNTLHEKIGPVDAAALCALALGADMAITARTQTASGFILRMSFSVIKLRVFNPNASEPASQYKKDKQVAKSRTAVKRYYRRSKSSCATGGCRALLQNNRFE